MIGFTGFNTLTYRIDNGANSFVSIQGVTYTADTWYHVALSYDSASGKAVAYLNGNNVGSITSSTLIGITFNSVPFNIAKTETSGGAFFEGLVGPVRTYNRALTAAEVSQNYAAQSALFQPLVIP